MTKVIAIANQKGGVGKTTTTLNFGSELSKRGNNVLMIDLDAQANLTIACGTSDPDGEYTVANTFISVINGEEITADMLPIYPYQENLSYMPSSVLMSKVNLLLVQAIAREQVLKQIIETIKAGYSFDYILIDCAPSLSVDLINALTAADEVLIVTAPARFSAAGTDQLIKTIGKISKSLNPALKISGVLFNRVDMRTNFAKDVISATRSSLSGLNVYDTAIASSIRVDESQAMGLTVAGYEKNNKVSEGFALFTDEYLGG